MKNRLLFLVLLLSFGSGLTLAQRQQKSEDYMNSAFDDIPFNLYGKLNYGYIVGDDGKNLKDGSLTAKCSINEKIEGLTDNGYERVNIVGTFNMNANYQKGMLNGSISSNYKVALNNENKTASMSGSFLKGVPNGNFVVKRHLGLKTTLNANYKNGILVGAYSCSLFNEDNRVVKYNGTLTQNGKLNGKWNLNDDIATFQNGFLISISSKDKSTKPALVDKAKKYLAGTITKEQLFEEHIVVKKDSIKLGEYARIAIFRDSGIEFEKIGGYDFREPNVIYYEYLEEVAKLSDKGYEALKKANIDYYVNNSINNKPEFLTNDINIRSSGDDSPYISVYTDSVDYYISKVKPDSWSVDAYMRKEQKDEIETLVKNGIKSKAVILFEHIVKELGDESTAGKFLLGKLDDKEIFEVDFENIKYQIENKFNYYKTNCKDCTDDDNLLMIIKERALYPSLYVNKSSFIEFEQRINNLDNDIEDLKIKNALSFLDFISIYEKYNINVYKYLTGDSFDKNEITVGMLEDLKAYRESFIKNSSLYPSDENPVVYLFNYKDKNKNEDEDYEDYEDYGSEDEDSPKNNIKRIYVNKESVDNFNIDDEIERLKISKAVPLSELIVELQLGNSDVINYLQDKPVEKIGNVVKELKKIHKEFLKTAKIYSYKGEPAAYVFEKDGKQYFVDKVSVESFVSVIEDAKDSRNKSRKESLKKGAKEFLSF